MSSEVGTLGRHDNPMNRNDNADDGMSEMVIETSGYYPDGAAEPLAIDELLTAGIGYGTELSITFTTDESQQTIDVTAQGPPVVERFDDVGVRVATLAVRKRAANYETYAVTVSGDGGTVFDGDPSVEETNIVGTVESIDVIDMNR